MSLVKTAGWSVIAAALAWAAVPVSASAEIYGEDGVSGPEVADILQTAGYRAELTKDGVGDPLVRTTMSGVNVQVYFYNCNSVGRCEDIQFSVGFDMANGTSQSVIDEWNRTKRFGRAYLDDENDPFIKVDLQVGPGGTPQLIAGYVRTMEAVLEGFTEHIDF